MPHFFFSACQPGAERMLKAEARMVRPDLRPAFARPGLVTWKTDVDSIPELTFARRSGASIGPATTPEAAIAAARAAGASRIHTWERDPGDEATALGEPAKVGELVLDVITSKGEASWLGTHRHAAGMVPFPGGLIPVEVPPEAPSRAYRKLEEALVWSGARPRRGEVALEIGSAPGGASYALLRRGLSVVGVDPGDMADVVAMNPGFRHIASAVGGVRKDDLPRRVDWLLLDVNLAPQVALHQLRRIVPMVRSTLRGALLTLKMNEERFAAEIPTLLARVAEMGLAGVRATQLPANRREICVYGRRPRG